MYVVRWVPNSYRPPAHAQTAFRARPAAGVEYTQMARCEMAHARVLLSVSVFVRELLRDEKEALSTHAHKSAKPDRQTPSLASLGPSALRLLITLA